MGAVHLATDRLHAQQVALKQVHIPVEELSWLSKSTAHNTIDELRLGLANEFQILAGLRHPHIISVLDYGFDQEQMPFYTMDYLADAQTVLEAATPMTFEGKIELVQQMFQALSYLHRRSIFHRDLKPNNILYSNGQLKLVDFGLSSHKGQNGSSGGTLLYMAPEMLANHDEPFVEASDLYAVGVILYQMLAGEHPFDVTSGAFVEQVLNDPPDLSKLDVAEPLAAFVGRLLANKPTERYINAQECLKAFHKALGQPAPPETAEIRESFLQRAAFVGREVELSQLQASLTESEQGTGAVWLIGGESGVGKSRLLDAFRAHALVAGWQVLTGQNSETVSMPFTVWQEIVLYLALSTELSELEASILQEINPRLSHLLNKSIPPAPEMSGSAYVQRLSFTLITLLQRQATPTLLLLEDLHWTIESLAPLKQMLKTLTQLTGVMVVGTYRHDERPELPQELSGAQTLLLERLGDGEITQLSQAILGEAAITPQLISLLTQETEGNTFFVVEVMRALAEEAGQLSEIGQMTLPQEVFTGGMAAILARRIQKVPINDLLLLRLAAVAGRQLDEKLLAMLVPDVDITHWLQKVAETTVLTIRENAWIFSHGKLRQAILSQLNPQQRQAMHRQVAQGIEQLYPEDRRHGETLLNHWQQAGDEEKELQYLLPVVEHLIRTLADDDRGRALIARGRALLPAEDERWVTLLNWQSKSHWQQGEYTEAEATAQKAYSLAKQLDDTLGVTFSLRNLVHVAVTLGAYDLAHDYSQEEVRLFQTIGDQRGTAIAYHHLGHIARVQGKYIVASNHLQQSLKILQALGDRYGSTGTLYNLGLIALCQEDYTASNGYLQQALAINQEIGDQFGVAISLQDLGTLRFEIGAYEQAIATLRQALEQFQAIKTLTWAGKSYGYTALSYIALGAYDTAMEVAQDFFQQRQTRELDKADGIVHLAVAQTLAAKAVKKTGTSKLQEVIDNIVKLSGVEATPGAFFEAAISATSKYFHRLYILIAYGQFLQETEQEGAALARLEEAKAMAEFSQLHHKLHKIETLLALRNK